MKIINDYMELIILNILNKEDSNGYLIDKILSDNKLDIKRELIYLEFKKLEKNELITSYWKDSNLEVRKKYYTITKIGKEYLKNKKKEWNDNKNILDKLLGENK